MGKYFHIVTEQEADNRIDKLLAGLSKDHSRSQVKNWIQAKNVTVNNQVVKANYTCQEGDEIEWSIPQKQTVPLIPENIPLSIIYEDNHLIIVNKPKGMVVHPSTQHQSGTLVHALLYHFDRLSNLAGEERPGIVHRLDKDTSGLLLVAKDNDTHCSLAQQFKENKIDRIYEAIVEGVIDHDTGMIEAPIGRDKANRLQMAVTNDGREATTHFKVLQRFQRHTFVECNLETGRTHQIRVHMNYIGYPIVGEPKYSNRKTSIKTYTTGQVLYAKKMIFIHPATNEQLTFIAERPSYLEKILDDLAKMS